MISRILIYVIIFLAIALGCGMAAPNAPTGLSHGSPVWVEDATLPKFIYDDGIEGWVVDSYLGNFATSTRQYDGPQREFGSIRTPSTCTGALGTGKTYCSFGPSGQYEQSVVEIDDTTGVARLFLGQTGLEEGPSDESFGGYVFYDDYNNTLYLISGFCLRKVVINGDGTRSVVTVAGDYSISGTNDGIGKSARFEKIYGWAAAGDGNIYIIGKSNVLRKVTPEGVVTTIPVSREDCTTSYGDPWWNVLMPMLNGFLSSGPDPDTLYVSDNYNIWCGNAILELHPSTGEVTRFLGTPLATDPYGHVAATGEWDGPAFTHLSADRGTKGIYSPFYSSFFYQGQDSNYIHRFGSDGWGRTVLQKKRDETVYSPSTLTVGMMQGVGLSSEQAVFNRIFGGTLLTWVVGRDNRGGIFLTTGQGLHIWRYYNSKWGGSK